MPLRTLDQTRGIPVNFCIGKSVCPLYLDSKTKKNLGLVNPNGGINCRIKCMHLNYRKNYEVYTRLKSSLSVDQASRDCLVVMLKFPYSLSMSISWKNKSDEQTIMLLVLKENQTLLVSAKIWFSKFRFLFNCIR